ncbi:hypothetical protein [Streptomyces sp. JB150]|uniref:hypothetical protein n=1 Tax=Streptomyces sp. JB150 TaxID=2714844 RepID=UPI00140805B8|nr:hypothetical protein [Streptomyces sp. JB150]QIJ61389.1 hypothetical protein G7Z13_04570 [Streptomyces sp. JB150]
MIHEEEPATAEDEGGFEDVDADFADPGPGGTYVLSSRRLGVVSGGPYSEEIQ